MTGVQTCALPILAGGRGEQVKLINLSLGTDKLDVHFNRLLAGGPRGKLHHHTTADNVYIVKRGEGDAPILVEPAKTYMMRPGDSHLYDVGAVHSPNRRGLTKLVRIEGKNLDHVKRSNIKAVEPATAK